MSRTHARLHAHCFLKRYTTNDRVIITMHIVIVIGPTISNKHGGYTIIVQAPRYISDSSHVIMREGPQLVLQLNIVLVNNEAIEERNNSVIVLKSSFDLAFACWQSHRHRFALALCPWFLRSLNWRKRFGVSTTFTNSYVKIWREGVRCQVDGELSVLMLVHRLHVAEVSCLIIWCRDRPNHDIVQV